MRTQLRKCFAAGAMAVAVPMLAVIGGCDAADKPKLADAPKFEPGPAKEAPKIPGQKTTYGSDSTYQKYMKGPTTK